MYDEEELRAAVAELRKNDYFFSKQSPLFSIGRWNIAFGFTFHLFKSAPDPHEQLRRECRESAERACAWLKEGELVEGARHFGADD
jgi:hypothetical protein